jgi:hypothetical protein
MSETVQHRKIFGEEEDPHEETPQMDVTSYKLKQIRIRYDPHRRQLAADLSRLSCSATATSAPDEPSEAESYTELNFPVLVRWTLGT